MTYKEVYDKFIKTTKFNKKDVSRYKKFGKHGIMIYFKDGSSMRVYRNDKEGLDG